MNRDPSIDPVLAGLLAEAPTLRAPDRLRADIASATSRKRQRPSWLTSLKEPPMRYRSQLVVGSPTLRVAAVLATAAVLALALAGAVIAGASPQPSPVPVAPVPATWVTGDIQPIDGTCTRRDVRVGDGVTRSSFECDQTWTSSDPRLSGDVSRPWNEDVYPTDEGAIAVGIDAPYLRNEGGGWACMYGFIAKGASPDSEPLTGNTFTCTGNGGYEGLSAVLVSTLAPDSFAEEFVGLIFSGDLPPVPEPPTAQ
jgi:hypothetical protein